MIFDEKSVCRTVFCREADLTEGPYTTPQAPLIIVLLSSGSAALAADSASYLLHAGDLFLAQSLAEIVPATNCHLIMIGLAGFAAEQAAQSLATPLHCDAHVCPFAPQCMAQLLEVAQEAPDQPHAALAYALLQALAEADNAEPRLPKLVADAIVAMRSNYAALYGVEELSAQLGVSKNHFVRVFSSEMGLPPGQYLTRVRVDAVKQLLGHRDYSLEVIASLCGFSGANYLCKVFKKETGQTPAAWRAANAVTHSRLATTEAEDALYV